LLFFIYGADEMDTLSPVTGHSVQKSVSVGATRTLYESMAIVKPFMNALQWQVLKSYCTDHEEGEYFQQLVCDLAKRIEGMPVTYDQDGQGDEAIAFLHYFHGSSDWYITEKDVEGGIHQAFGYAVLNGDLENAELGYISIPELTANRVELELCFSPVTLEFVKRALRKTQAIARPRSGGAHAARHAG
jgi:hypothetical protein